MGPKQRGETQRLGWGHRGQGHGLLTLLAGRRGGAPGQVPLTGEDVGAQQLVARLTLVGEHGASNQVPVGRCPPAPLRRGQLRASVVPGDLCRGKIEFGGCSLIQGALSSLGGLAPAPSLGTSWNPTHLGVSYPCVPLKCNTKPWPRPGFGGPGGAWNWSVRSGPEERRRRRG